MHRRIAIVSLAFVLSTCISGGGYKSVADKPPARKDCFANPTWNGKQIPSGQQCQKFNGKGGTPPLVVENIPAGANAIIVEFNNLSFAPLSNGGGHGKIGFWHKGGEENRLLAEQRITLGNY